MDDQLFALEDPAAADEAPWGEEDQATPAPPGAFYQALRAALEQLRRQPSLLPPA